MKESVMFFGSLLLAFCLMTWGMVSLIERECEVHAQSFEHEWTFIGGCMVKHNDKWLPMNSIRAFQDEGEEG